MLLHPFRMWIPPGLEIWVLLGVNVFVTVLSEHVVQLPGGNVVMVVVGVVVLVVVVVEVVVLLTVIILYFSRESKLKNLNEFILFNSP